MVVGFASLFLRLLVHEGSQPERLMTCSTGLGITDYSLSQPSLEQAARFESDSWVQAGVPAGKWYTEIQIL